MTFERLAFQVGYQFRGISILLKKNCVCCSKKAKMRCSDCKTFHYCSRECVNADWSVHKLVCPLLKPFDKERRITSIDDPSLGA
jgi:hypothetical protein